MTSDNGLTTELTVRVGEVLTSEETQQKYLAEQEAREARNAKKKCKKGSKGFF